MRRYVGIDVLKFFCFCFVVFIHCPFPGVFGGVVKAFARFATPTFFAISGFFYNENAKSSLKKSFRYLGIYAIMNMFWFLVYSGIKLTKLCDLARWSILNVDFKSIFYAVVFGRAFGNEYLWFLQALGCLYILLFLLEKTKLRKIVFNMWYVWVALFWLFSIGLYVVTGKQLPVHLYRNCFFDGLAFFAMGNWMKNNYQKINTGIMMTIGSISTVVEFFLWGDHEFYLGSIFIILGVMTFFMKREFGESNTIGKWGRKYALYLYLWHPFSQLLLSIIMRLLNLNENTMLQWISPVAVITLTIFECIGANKISRGV